MTEEEMREKLRTMGCLEPTKPDDSWERYIRPAELEIRELFTPELMRQLNDITAPYEIRDITNLFERLAIWLVGARSSTGDAFAKLQHKDSVARKILPKAISHAKSREKSIRQIIDEQLPIDNETLVLELEDWLLEIELLLERCSSAPSSRGAPGFLQQRLLVNTIAASWQHTTGSPPPIQVDGRFHEYVNLMIQIIPVDRRPVEFQAETIKNWEQAYRAKRI